MQTQPLTHLGLRRGLALWGKMNVLIGVIWSRLRPAPYRSRVNEAWPRTRCFFLALMMVPAAEATILFPLSIEELTSKAHIVLHGTVGSKSVQRDPEGRIYTRIEVEVTEAWKGQARGKTFTMVQGGGVLGEEIAAVDGQEEFSIGEEVVVFLILNQRGEGVVVGLSQGKFKVRAGEAGGEKVMHNLFHGGVETTETGANAKAKGGRLSIGDLKRRVQGGAR